MKKIFAANWKLFKGPKEAREFFAQLKTKSGNVNGEMLFFPPAISLEATSESVKGSQIQWGAQNCFSQNQGAFTGENSASMVKELGATHMLIGHSERRKIFKETDSEISEKIALVQSHNLIPVLCIGETLQERESGSTNQVNERQLKEGLTKADKSKKIIVAYEPVWAIGTGKVATPEQVAETHAAIYKTLSAMGFNSTPILYGGSVKPDNAAALLSINHVDGFLIGGASLEVDSYLAICNAAR